MAQCELGLDWGTAALWSTEQALRLDPENEWAFRLRAIALLTFQRFAEAQRAAEDAIRLAPLSYLGYVSLANVHANTPGRTLGALAPAAKALELAPAEAETHFIHGLALARAGRRRAAKRAYRDALALDPEHSRARNNLGVLALAAGRTTHATDHFASALQSDPRSKVGVKNLTTAYVVLLARLNLILMLTFFLVLAGVSSDAATSATWPVGRVAGLGVGLVLIALLLVWSGGVSREMFRQMWRIRSVRWLLLPPASMAVAIVFSALLPYAFFGLAILGLLASLIISPYARRRSRAVSAEARWRRK